MPHRSNPAPLRIELIVWHHRRRTRRLPYSAAAYLLDPSKPEHHQVLEAGSCTDAGTEGEAARDALRELQERLGASDVLKAKERYDEVLRAALGDPVGAISAAVRVIKGLEQEWLVSAPRLDLVWVH